MQPQLKMLVGVAVFATLALAGMLGIFTFSAAQTVQADGHSATRSFSPASVVPSGEVTVTVTFDNFEAGPGSLTETLPAGFAYKPTSSSVDDDFIIITGQEAGFIFLSTPQSLTYVVTASSDEAPYDFSGTFSDFSRMSVDVGGATTVTVGDPLLAKYDLNNNDMIDKTEVITAINDYFDLALTRAEVIQIINLYFEQP